MTRITRVITSHFSLRHDAQFGFYGENLIKIENLFKTSITRDIWVDGSLHNKNNKGVEHGKMHSTPNSNYYQSICYFITTFTVLVAVFFIYNPGIRFSLATIIPSNV